MHVSICSSPGVLHYSGLQVAISCPVRAGQIAVVHDRRPRLFRLALCCVGDDRLLVAVLKAFQRFSELYFIWRRLIRSAESLRHRFTACPSFVSLDARGISYGIALIACGGFSLSSRPSIEGRLRSLTRCTSPYTTPATSAASTHAMPPHAQLTKTSLLSTTHSRGTLELYAAQCSSAKPFGRPL